MFSCCNILHFRLQMYNKYLEYTRILAEKVNLFVFLGSRCIAAHLPPMVTLRPRGTAANGRISIDQDTATRGCQIPLREILHRHRLSHTKRKKMKKSERNRKERNGTENRSSFL